MAGGNHVGVEKRELFMVRSTVARLVFQEFRLAASVLPLQILKSRDGNQTPPDGFVLSHPSLLPLLPRVVTCSMPDM